MTAAGDAAVLARLRSDPLLQNSVYEGLVSNPPKVYVAVHAGIGEDTAERFTGPSNANQTTYVIHSVAIDVTGAKWAARRVQALLKDWTPAIDGARRIRHTVSRPPQLDRDANPPLYYLVDQYDLTIA